MEISKTTERKYLHDMAIDQLVADYSAQGYRVEREKPLGPYRADLVAQRGEEVIVFEVKAGPAKPSLPERLAGLSNYVRARPNHTFRVIVATPPRQKSIAIDNLDEVLAAHFQKQLPDELAELSTHTRVEGVSDVEINQVTVSTSGQLIASGAGVIDVQLQYGADGDLAHDNGLSHVDSFPFSFDAVLKLENGKWSFQELEQCVVDTSSFYE